MNHLIRLTFLAVVAFAVGCGREPNQPRELQSPTPLSVTEWKQLPVEEKYQPESFERLKLHDPKLRSDRVWHNFMVKVVVPERKKDIPEG